MESRPFDLLLFGVTGTLGRLAAEYLAAHAPPGLRVALAGRNAAKLEAVRRTLGPTAREWPLLTADSGDAASLEHLARQARVVCTTVGPYAKYGLPLVEACVRNGTHYADLTGELDFMRESIDRYDARARSQGIRIVHGCGFDSIPSDLGVYMLHEYLRGLGNSGRMKHTTFAVEAMRERPAHGTLASMVAISERLARNRDLARLYADPHALSPERTREQDLAELPGPTRPRFDASLGEWTLPWVMASTNTRVVRRTNALLGHAYGRAFQYREVVGLPRGLRDVAYGAAMMGMWWFTRALRWAPLRHLLARWVAKPVREPATRKPGRGYFRIRLEAVSEEGMRLTGLVSGLRPPGTEESANMLVQVGLGLALDAERMPARSGVLTPVSALGPVLLERLRAAGVTFAVVPVQPAMTYAEAPRRLPAPEAVWPAAPVHP